MNAGRQEGARMAGKGKKLVAGAAVVIAAMLAVLLIAPGMLICPAVGTGGSLALGVPVRLKGAGLRPLSGGVDLTNLEVSNPRGYTTKNAIEVGRIAVRAPFPSLLRRSPRIESITVEDPAVTLEQGLTGSNLSEILSNAGRGGGSGGGVKFVIGTLRIAGARVKVVPKIAGIPAAYIPLPPIELKELGGEGAGE